MPSDEVHKKTEDLSKRFWIKSYLRDTLQDTPQDTLQDSLQETPQEDDVLRSSKIIDLSRRIYGIYHGDGQQRWTNLALRRYDQAYTTAESYLFGDVSRYREALDNMLPYICQALIEGDVDLEYAIPYTLNDLGYVASTKANDLILGYCHLENHGARVHNTKLERKYQRKSSSAGYQRAGQPSSSLTQTQFRQQ